jgi:MerR family transcriptional regulator, copper efflux regulator
MGSSRLSAGDPTDPVERACSLDEARYAERVASWRELCGDADPDYLPDGGVKVRFPAERSGRVLELVAAEHQCCPFVTFYLTLTSGYIELEAYFPQGTEPLLTELFGAPNTSGGTCSC